MMHDLYEQHLKQLFRSLLEQLSRFEDVFWKVSADLIMNNKIDDNPFSEYNGLSFNTAADKISSFIHDAESNHLSTIDSIGLQLSLTDYRYNEENSFSLETLINIQFDKYRYRISDKMNEILNKKYSDPLTTAEIDTIVRNYVKSVFEEIKLKEN